MAACLPDPAELGDNMHGVTCAGTWVTGHRHGRVDAREVYLHHVVDNAWSMAEYGSQAVVWQTAVNPVVALELVASGAWSGAGVLGPEALPAEPFLDLLNESGAPWACDERTPRLRPGSAAAAPVSGAQVFPPPSSPPSSPPTRPPSSPPPPEPWLQLLPLPEPDGVPPGAGGVVVGVVGVEGIDVGVLGGVIGFCPGPEGIWGDPCRARRWSTGSDDPPCPPVPEAGGKPPPVVAPFEPDVPTPPAPLADPPDEPLLAPLAPLPVVRAKVVPPVEIEPPVAWRRDAVCDPADFPATEEGQCDHEGRRRADGGKCAAAAPPCAGRLLDHPVADAVEPVGRELQQPTRRFAASFG